MVQEAVADQLKNLEEKLHEYKVRHKADEEAVEDEIATLEDTLAEVKVSRVGRPTQVSRLKSERLTSFTIESSDLSRLTL